MTAMLLAESPLAYPHAAPPAERITFALRFAILAPSSHNSQPWLFHLDGDSVELYADRSRGLHVVDPTDRELTISCGAALHHLRTAFAAAGEGIEVERIFAHDRLARVKLLGRTEPSPRARRRLDGAVERRTVRTDFDDTPAHDDVVRELARAVEEEGCSIAFAEHERRHRLADLVAVADRVQAASPDFRKELASWLHPNHASYDDGMTASTLGIGDLASHVAPFVVRRFDWGKGRASHDRALAVHSPLLAVLGTLSDTPRDWLAAGEALSAMLLDAAARGLAASFLNQPVEVPPLRTELRTIFSEVQTPQLVLRLGVPIEQPAEAERSARRPLEDVVV